MLKISCSVSDQITNRSTSVCMHNPSDQKTVRQTLDDFYIFIKWSTPPKWLNLFHMQLYPVPIYCQPKYFRLKKEFKKTFSCSMQHEMYKNIDHLPYPIHIQHNSPQAMIAYKSLISNCFLAEIVRIVLLWPMEENSDT